MDPDLKELLLLCCLFHILAGLLQPSFIEILAVVSVVKLFFKTHPIMLGVLLSEIKNLIVKHAEES